jgi:hypothetical protein
MATGFAAWTRLSEGIADGRVPVVASSRMWWATLDSNQ